MGKTRKCRARENEGGAGDDYRLRRLPLSTVSSGFFFRVRPFSIPRARLSRSLEQATQSGTKATKFFGAAVIFFVIINCLKLLNCPNRLLQAKVAVKTMNNNLYFFR